MLLISLCMLLGALWHGNMDLARLCLIHLLLCRVWEIVGRMRSKQSSNIPALWEE